MLFRSAGIRSRRELRAETKGDLRSDLGQSGSIDLPHQQPILMAVHLGQTKEFVPEGDDRDHVPALVAQVVPRARPLTQEM